MEKDFNILLSDECALTYLGILRLCEELKPRRAHISQVASLQQASAFIQAHQVDAVILDSENNVRLAATKAFLRETRLKHPQIKLIVFTSSFSLSLLTMAQATIIDGFLSRREPLAHLTRSLQQILFANQNLVSTCFNQQAAERELSASCPTLTPAESRTLRFILEGKTPAQISRITHRSIKTISSQKRSVMRKLGVTSSSQLIMMSKGLYQNFY